MALKHNVKQMLARLRRRAAGNTLIAESDLRVIRITTSNLPIRSSSFSRSSYCMLIITRLCGYCTQLPIPRM
jgi:hypothetical protein